MTTLFLTAFSSPTLGAMGDVNNNSVLGSPDLLDITVEIVDTKTLADDKVRFTRMSDLQRSDVPM